MEQYSYVSVNLVLSVGGAVILMLLGIIGYLIKGKITKIDSIEHNYVTRLDAIKEDVAEIKETVSTLFTEHKIYTGDRKQSCLLK